MSDSPLTLSPRFYRAHGLGNDYLVFEGCSPADGWTVSSDRVRSVCDRHAGVGSDGIVALLDRAPADGVFPLRMFNPDGSEFERSGNGLRVLASYLSREGLVGSASFAVTSGGARIEMEVLGVDAGQFDVRVAMGRAEVGLQAVAGDATRLDGAGCVVHPELGPIDFVPVGVGNPHAVVFPSERSLPLEDVGPFFEGHSAFPRGINLQLVRREGESQIAIEIWERGVGPTAASGTSSCAAAVASVVKGLVDPGPVAVRMRGGRLDVTVSSDLDVALRGPVREVCEGVLTKGFLGFLRS